ncbi:hypothetical protein RB195_005122 [Necator americanus]
MEYRSNNSSPRSQRTFSALCHGLWHVKWVALIKQVVVLLYVVRSMHANLALDVLCYDSAGAEAGNIPKVKICLRPSCMWLHWIFLRLPHWFELSEAICTGLLFFVLMSTVLMLCALYMRHQEHRLVFSPPRWLKVIIVTPSLLVEFLLFALICYGIVASAWHWNKFNVPKSSLVLAVIYAIILVVFVFLQLALHLCAVVYVCHQTNAAKPMRSNYIDYGFETSNTDSPTNAVLAMLKYQAKTENVPLMSDVSSHCPTTSAQNSSKRKSMLASFELSPTNNNDTMLSHLNKNSPSIAIPMDSPPYARLRAPVIYRCESTHFCDPDDSSQEPKICELSNSLIRSENNEEWSYQKQKLSFFGGPHLATSLDDYSCLE